MPVPRVYRMPPGKSTYGQIHLPDI